MRKIILVLSTGRCGTKFIANLMDLSLEATVIHEPSPGLEPYNPIGHALFLANPEYYNKLEVPVLRPLEEHARIYETIRTPVFGNCHNSLYPFGLTLFRYYLGLGMECKIIHLIRNPLDCCKSILKMEGQQGYDELCRNFSVRAASLYTSDSDAVRSVEIWKNINENIRYQMAEIERIAPSSTIRIRIEDLNEMHHIRLLFDFLDLRSPSDDEIRSTLYDKSYEVRHSHQSKLDSLGLKNYSEEDFRILVQEASPLALEYGYTLERNV